MFSFNLPDEMKLKVFNKSSRQDQARLAQVDKKFNELSKNNKLELVKYKSTCTIHSVGHTHLVVQITSPQSFYATPYSLFTVKNNKEVFNSGMALQTDSVDSYVESMKGDTGSLIKFLKKRGATAEFNAEALEEAMNRENRSIIKINS